MSTTDNINPENKLITDHDVTIELVNGSRLRFLAGWNEGLAVLVRDYEAFMGGPAQQLRRYSLTTVDKKQHVEVLVKFAHITAIHLSTKVGPHPRARGHPGGRPSPTPPVRGSSAPVLCFPLAAYESHFSQLRVGYPSNKKYAPSLA